MERVHEHLRGRIVVGHALHNDFKERSYITPGLPVKNAVLVRVSAAAH
jgi:hypothetical protein